MPATSQLNLRGFKTPRYDHAVIEVAASIGHLNRSCPGITTDQVRQLVIRGALWAWDVSSPKAQTPELRLLSASIAECHDAGALLDDEFAMCAPVPSTPEGAVAVVMKWIAKHCSPGKPWITSEELGNALLIQRTHIVDLFREGALARVSGSPDFRKGPRGYVIVAREEVERFLTENIFEDGEE